MPKISQKAAKMPASPIRKLVPFANQAKEKGIKVYHLNIGQPDIKTPESAIKAIQNINLEVLEYAPSEGNLSYREKLATYYNLLGFSDITPQNFIVTNGGSEALSIALATICDEGNQIIIPEPYYANYNGFSTALGIEVVPIISTIETGFSLPNISDFEAKITDKTKAILICNPGNPTGYLYSQEELQQLKEIAIKHNIFLLSDEVYREYVYDNHKHYSLLEFSELSEHVIVIDSESKRYSMCGVRIGCMVTRNSQVLEMALKFAQARLSPVLLGQIAATAAHDNDTEYIANVRAEYIQRRNILVEKLNEIPNVYCPVPKGAFYCMAELPVEDTDVFAQWLLEEFNDENETVMLAPAGGFYSDVEKGKKQVRIAYVLKEADLIRATEILAKALVTYNQK